MLTYHHLQGKVKLITVTPECDEKGLPTEDLEKRYVMENHHPEWMAYEWDKRFPKEPMRWGAGRKPVTPQCYLPSWYYDWVIDNA